MYVTFSRSIETKKRLWFMAFNNQALWMKMKEPYLQSFVSLLPEVVCLFPTEARAGFIVEKSPQTNLFSLSLFLVVNDVLWTVSFMSFLHFLSAEIRLYLMSLYGAAPLRHWYNFRKYLHCNCLPKTFWWRNVTKEHVIKNVKPIF